MLRCPYCQRQLNKVSSETWECLNTKGCGKGASVDFVRRFGVMHVRSVGDDDQYTWKRIAESRFGTGKRKKKAPQETGSEL